jgi:hypothetical protein
MKFLLLFLVLFCGAAKAQLNDGFLKRQGLSQLVLEGRPALEAVYGRKVVFHESIGYNLVWLFMPSGHMHIVIKDKKFEGRFGDAENGAICTTYLSLDNIMVCYKFILRDNKLTKIDLASQIGSEGDVADSAAIEPWPQIVPEFCAKFNKIISAAQTGSFAKLADQAKGQVETTASGLAVYESKIALNKYNCIILNELMTEHQCTEPIKTPNQATQDLSFDGYVGQFRACMSSQILDAKYDVQDYLRSAQKYLGDANTIREAYFTLRNNVKVNIVLRGDKDCMLTKYCRRGLATDMITTID